MTLDLLYKTTVTSASLAILYGSGPVGLSMANTNDFRFSLLARPLSLLSRPSASLQKIAKLPIFLSAFLTVSASSFVMRLVNTSLVSRANTIATGLLPLRQTRHSFLSGVGPFRFNGKNGLGRATSPTCGPDLTDSPAMLWATIATTATRANSERHFFMAQAPLGR